ncbi:hypothetical protein [Albidovulum sp.]|uniref:hypothetical protein n=1 Tax=Albidovulum sp. TaxID=1872424 RepID=UPI001DF0253D|nr:hypothetical protein [Paracoccaceae bacterium]
MRFVKYAAALALVGALAGCLENDAERGVAGAAAGALIAGSTENNPLTGAIIGGAAGVFCDDAGVCR